MKILEGIAKIQDQEWLWLYNALSNHNSWTIFPKVTDFRWFSIPFIFFRYLFQRIFRKKKCRPTEIRTHLKFNSGPYSVKTMQNFLHQDILKPVSRYCLCFGHDKKNISLLKNFTNWPCQTRTNELSLNFRQPNFS